MVFIMSTYSVCLFFYRNTLLLIIILSVKKFKMSFIDHRAIRMITKNVKKHIKVFVLESINKNNTPNHFELEKS